MANLTIKDIINNTINQLQEAKGIIEEHGGEAGMLTAEEELCDDILTSIDRLSSIENIIHFALCAAVYAGHIEANHTGFCSINTADSIDNLNAYLEIAEQYNPVYTKDGLISTKDMYNDIFEKVNEKFQENPPAKVIITASELALDTDDLFEDEDYLSEIVGNRLSDTYGFCHYGFDMEKVYNEFNEPSQVIVSNIKWDTTD